MKHEKKILLLTMLTTSACITLASNWHSNYDKISQMQFSFAQAQLPFLRLGGHERVLDVGCGTGRTTNFFADQLSTGSIVGVDTSDDIISFAQQEYVKNNINFKVGDATNLQFYEEFDVAYSFFCLQWVDEKQNAIHGIKRALKKGGRAYIFVPTTSKDFDIGIMCIHKVLDLHPEWKPYVILPDNEKPQAWLERFEKAGLCIEKTDIVKKESEYPSKRAWNEYCYGLGITSLPEDTKKQFIEEVGDLMYEHYGLQDEDPYIRVTTIMAFEITKS